MVYNWQNDAGKVHGVYVVVRVWETLKHVTSNLSSKFDITVNGKGIPAYLADNWFYLFVVTLLVYFIIIIIPFYSFFFVCLLFRLLFVVVVVGSRTTGATVSFRPSVSLDIDETKTHAPIMLLALLLSKGETGSMCEFRYKSCLRPSRVTGTDHRNFLNPDEKPDSTCTV